MVICHLVPHLSLCIISPSIDTGALQILASHIMQVGIRPDKYVVDMLQTCDVFNHWSSFGMINSAITLSFSRLQITLITIY